MEEEKVEVEIKSLLESKQYTRLRQKVAEMNDADIAAVMEDLEDEELLKMFRILPKSMAADVFSYLDDNVEILHTQGKNYILSDIDKFIKNLKTPASSQK